MLTHFPKYFSTRAILCYVVTLVLVSAFFMSHALPYQFVLFGLASVLIFFIFSTRLTVFWYKYPSNTFTKKLFVTAALIRLVYVVFIYFYYIEMTGVPHSYHAGDELLYDYIATQLKENGIVEFSNLLDVYGISFSDSGYCWWLAVEYSLLGTGIGARFVKCIIDAFTCVLIYNLAKRNFGEAVGRIAAVFCLLMPNMWFYCGVTLKETEMAFMVVLFVERADLALRAQKISFQNILLSGLAALAMFAFRTVLASVLFASLMVALVFSSGKQLQTWKKIVYGIVFAVWVFMTVGVEITQEIQGYWEGRDMNREIGYESKFNRLEDNSFQKYATATVFAPLIFTIPLSSMVEVPNQEIQMMLNGGNFIKNVISGLVIFAMVSLLISGEWKKHVLPIVVILGYLVVLVFSTFAHSERFHFPVLALELMFGAYGVSLLHNKHKRWIVIWLVAVCVMEVIWNWIKLSGRGWA